LNFGWKSGYGKTFTGVRKITLNKVDILHKKTTHITLVMTLTDVKKTHTTSVKGPTDVICATKLLQRRRYYINC